MLRRTVILLLSLAAHAPGQSASGVITGRVVDPAGKSVPAAEIRLVNQDTRNSQSATSDLAGEFVFSSVEPGTFTLLVVAPGFKQYEQRNLQLSASGRLSAGEVKLEIGSVSDSIEVKGAPAPVQTASSERSQAVDSAQLESLPTPGRDYLGMLVILPGVVNDIEGAASLGVFNSPAAMSGVTGNNNSISVDGVSGNTRGGGHLDTPVNLDAVAEVRVVTNTYQAEYGKGGASVINVVTKSGVKVFHGAIYVLDRDKDFNATSFINNLENIPKPDYSYATLGFNLGGPIYWPKKFNSAKDKLFFFFSTEGEPGEPTGATHAFTVPTALERSGDFSQSLGVNGQLIVVKDPLAHGAPFPGNMIPSNRLDPNLQKLLNVFPLPNLTNRSVTRGNYNYVIMDPHLQATDRSGNGQQILRIDHYASQKFRYYFRGMYMSTFDGGVNSPANIMNWGIGPVTYRTQGPNLGATATYTFSPTLVNEFTLGYALWTERQTEQNNYLPQVERDKLGITLGQFYPANNPLDLIPAMTFGGITQAASTGFTARFPISDDAGAWTLTDNISKVWRRHIFKAGVQAERTHYNQYHTGSNAFTGAFDFSQNINNPIDTGYAYSNAVLGYFNSYTEATTRTDYRPITPILEWYVQDSWAVNRRVTLDLGVRFTAGLPQYPANNAIANFVPSLFNPAQAPALYRPVLVGGQPMAQNPLTGAILPQAYQGLIVPGSGNLENGTAVAGAAGWPRGMVDFQGILPAPRVGFAWDVFGNGKMAVRGGFGITYNPRDGSGTLGNLSANPPLILTPQEFYGTTATFLTTAGSLGVSSFADILSRNQKLTEAYNWSLGVQREIGFDTVLDVAYVGNMGRHIEQTYNLNEVPYGARFLPQNQDPTNPGLPLNDNFFRPYAGWGNITAQNFGGNSSYHSLQAQARRRLAHGFSFGAAYTWSKALDNGINVTTYLPNRPWNYEESSFDRTHVVAANYTWEAPRLAGLHPGAVRWLVCNWMISGITRFQSGAPLDMPYLGMANLISGADLTGGGDGWRPVIVGNPVIAKGQRSFYRYFNPAAFAAPFGPYRSGNAPATFARGPGINNWDLAIARQFRFKMGEKGMVFTVRGEAFNAFNHTQFSGVNVTPIFDQTGAQVNPAFGQVTSVRDPRIMQFMLRLAF
jgi:hypothetical protein